MRDPGNEVSLIVAFSNFSGVSVDGKHLMRVQSEGVVDKFLRRSVNGFIIAIS